MSVTQRYATFLSHNSKDKPAVQQIAEALEAQGLVPFLDAWDLHPGDAFRKELEHGLAACDTALVFFGPHGQGNWQAAEIDILVDRAIRQRNDFRIAPVVLDGAEPDAIDSFLKRYGWIDLRPGLNDPAVLEQLIAFVQGRPFRGANDQIPDAVQPYRGLLRFEAEHADLFFGRDDDVRQLAERLQRRAFVAVVGPSGNGKSSVVRAGLHSQAAESVFADRPPGLTIRMRPGKDPLRALADQLREAADQQGPPRDPAEPLVWTEREIERMRADGAALNKRLSSQFARLDGRIILLVDQFEELFTQSADDGAERATANEALGDTAHFMDNLIAAVRDADERLCVLITLRADFLGRCLQHPGLRDLMQDRLFLLGDLDEAGLRAAIRLPAERSGAFFEKGLVEVILRDVQGERGSLPLLELALKELWRRRQGRWLTLEAYQVSGGVTGALEQLADATFRGLPSDLHRQVARSILVRLTTLGEGVADTRRRVDRAELALHGVPAGTVDETLAALSHPDARLIVADKHQTYEVTHEALIQEWPELRGWLHENRDQLRLQRQVTERAKAWADAFSRLDAKNGDMPADGDQEDATGHLLRKGQLEDAEELADNPSVQLSDLERAFLDASIAERERERDHQRRQLRRFRNLAIVATLFAVVTLVIGGVAWDQRNQAQQRGTLLLANFLTSEALRLQDSPERLELSVLLGVESMRRSPTVRADELIRASTSLLISSTSESHDSALSAIRVDPVTGQFATVTVDGVVTIRAADGGREICRMEHAGEVSDIVFRPEDDLVVTAEVPNRRSKKGRRAIRIWRASDCSRQLTLPQSERVVSLSLSRNGRRLVTGGWGGFVRIWELPTGRRERLLEHPDAVRQVLVTGDERYVITSCFDNSVRIWDAETWKLRATISIEGEKNPGQMNIRTLTASEDSSLVMTGTTGGVVRVWSIPDGKLLHTFRTGATTRAVAVDPHSTVIAAGDKRGEIRVWSLKTEERVAEMRHRKAVTDLAFWGGESFLLSASEDTTGRLWLLPSGEELKRFSHGERVVGIEGRASTSFVVVTGSADRTVKLWDLKVLLENRIPVSPRAYAIDSEETWVTFQDDKLRLLEGGTGLHIQTLLEGVELRTIALNKEGTLLAAVTEANTIQVWDVARRELRQELVSQAEIGSVVFDDHSRFVGATTVAGTASVWRIDSGNLVASIPHSYYLHPIGFDSGSSVVIGTLPIGLQGWGLASSSPSVVWQDTDEMSNEDTESSEQIAGLDEGELVISGVRSVAGGQFSMYFIERNGLLIQRVNPQAGSKVVEFSPKGRFVARTSAGGELRILDTSKGEPIRVFKVRDVSTTAFSMDDRYLAASDGSGLITVWDLETGVKIAEIDAGDTVSMMSFSTKGDYLAAAAARTARIWEVKRSLETTRIAEDRPVHTVRFGDSDRKLVTVAGALGQNNGHRIRLWTWMPEQVIREACLLVTRNMSPKEWDRYLANEPYRRTCQNLPANPDAYAAARLLAEDGDLDASVHAFQETATILGDNVVNFRDEAVSAYVKGLVERAKAQAGGAQGLKEAKALLETAASAGPGHRVDPEADSRRYSATAEIERAGQLLLTYEIESAVDHIRRASRFDPSAEISSEVLSELCRRGSLMGHASLVLPFCEEALGREPERADFRDSRGFARAMLDDLEGAIEDFEAFRTWTEDEELAQLRTEWIRLLRIGKNPLAMVTARNVLEEGRLLVLSGDVHKAIERYDTAQEIDTELEVPVQAWSELCLYGALRSMAEAIQQACDTAVELAPDWPFVWYARGVYRTVAHDGDQAARDFEKCLELVEENGTTPIPVHDWLQAVRSGNGTDRLIADIPVPEVARPVHGFAGEDESAIAQTYFRDAENF